MENLNQYLEPCKDGTYIHHVNPSLVHNSWIRIPEGAEIATKGVGEVNFWKNQDREFYFNSRGGWSNNCGETLSEYLGRNPEVEIVWQRTTQNKEIEQEVNPIGLKFDSNKPRFSLLPKGAVNSVIDVLEFGAKKYEANNWQKVDNAKERYYNAAMRHIDSWWNGEKTDQETGIHHLAHAATNLFFLIWFDEQENKNG